MPKHTKKAATDTKTPAAAKKNTSDIILDPKDGFVNCVHRSSRARCAILTTCQCIGTLKCGFYETEMQFKKRQEEFKHVRDMQTKSVQ